jgi:REP element-mobilizing transposase RayT
MKMKKKPLAKPARSAYRRNLPHLQKRGRTVFVTFVTHRRWKIPESVRNLILKHCLYENGIKIHLHGVIVMPDHVHMIFTPLTDDEGATYGLSEIMQGIKGASARRINKALGRAGKVWQGEFFDRVLRSDENVRSKVNYICQNPVRKGLVEMEDEYPWLWREWIEGTK